MAALRQQAARVTVTGPVVVTVTASAVGSLPAAVEVAAYRTVTEAVLNVVRHARARLAHVDVRLGAGGLELEVTDDGVGGDWRPGVGLTGMRERVEQVGGDLEVGGGRVRARLPLAPQTDETTLPGAVSSGTRVAW